MQIYQGKSVFWANSAEMQGAPIVTMHIKNTMANFLFGYLLR